MPSCIDDFTPVPTYSAAYSMMSQPSLPTKYTVKFLIMILTEFARRPSPGAPARCRVPTVYRDTITKRFLTGSRVCQLVEPGHVLRRCS